MLPKPGEQRLGSHLALSGAMKLLMPEQLGCGEQGFWSSLATGLLLTYNMWLTFGCQFLRPSNQELELALRGPVQPKVP